MAAQDVADLIPRVRRAIEGPDSLNPPLQPLGDPQIEALAADCIADIILLTGGEWGHTLERVPDESSDGVEDYYVDPPLSLEEESLIAAQAALTYFFHQYKDAKVSERVVNEAQAWEWERSSTLLRDYLKLLVDTRNQALTALKATHPVLARAASILVVRDRVAAAYLEPWTGEGLGGGYQLIQ